MAAAPVCLVAGIGPGVGLAVARRFAREGFAIAMMARRAQAMADHRAPLVESGAPDVQGFACDLSDLAAIPEAVSALRAAMGEPSVVVINTGHWNQQPALTFPAVQVQADLALGVTAPLVLIQAFADTMARSGGGTILVTGGGLALFPEYGGEVISLVAAKSAVRGVVRALAPVLKPDGVHLATVTIAGTVAAGTPFDPAFIAEHYWQLHMQAPDAWEVERVFRGADSRSDD